MTLIVLILLIVAGIFKGLMDATADEGLKNVTWVYKYDFTKKNRKHWWYFGTHKPRYPERFPFSSTFLVFVTDQWHLYQFIMLRCFYMAISILITNSIILMFLYGFFFFPIVLGYPFEGTYNLCRHRISKKNEKNN